MAAAPADYRPKQAATEKIKKGETETSWSLELSENPDILGAIKGDLIRVGFAAESENMMKNAREKRHRKNLDLIVANDITQPNSGFDSDSNKVVLIDRDGKVTRLPLLPKLEVADKILDRVVAVMNLKKRAEGKS
jgi:phosphopantothenoylcysteine decarboxylase/phosphopantothenate--cysteine ligase